MKRWILLLVLGGVVSCGGSSPTSPSGGGSTKVIRLEAGLTFGSIPVGSTATRILRVYSEGTQPLTVTGLTGPSGYKADWTSGVIQPGTSQGITISFSPTESKTYNGTVTVQADQTSGTNTTPISGSGLRELFVRAGVGDTVFDMPTDVSRVKIVGDYSGSCQNFIVHVGGEFIVNEILGSCTSTGHHFEGIYLVSGGTTEIVSSNGVHWSFTEQR